MKTGRRLQAKRVAETPSPFDDMSQPDKSQTGGWRPSWWDSRGSGSSGDAALNRFIVGYPGEANMAALTRESRSTEDIAEIVREAVNASHQEVHQTELRDLKHQVETLKALKEPTGGGQLEMSKQERAQREKFEIATRRVKVAENIAKKERAKSNSVLRFMQYAGGYVDRRSRGDADPSLVPDEDDDPDDPDIGELSEKNLKALGIQ
jgi:hypothetical protein